MKRDVRVILHNVRSAHNVGAILRTADGCGVSVVYLSGYTPLPIDTFGKENGDIAKTALGAEKNIQWKHVASISLLITMLKKEGVYVVAIEQGKYSKLIQKFKEPKKIAYVFGNEVQGLNSATLKKCDAVLDIPMLGKKESLNVSAAAAIVLYRSLI